MAYATQSHSLTKQMVSLVQYKYACPCYNPYCKTWSDKPGICPTHNIKLVYTRLIRKPKHWVFGLKKQKTESKSLNKLLRS